MDTQHKENVHSDDSHEEVLETKKKKTAKISSKDKKIVGLEKKVEMLKTELEEREEQHKRVLAEYANYKRRTTEEKEQIGAFTKSEVLKALVPALDSLDHALENTENSDEKVREGIELTVRQFREITKGLGMEIIYPLNHAFNPEEHNAVTREDAEDIDNEEIVTEVFQKGYKCDGRVIRPAMVKVAN